MPDNARDGSEQPQTLLVSVVLENALKHGAEIDDDLALVGREALLARFTQYLTETQGGRASLLVAGYRGVGKTNVVRRAIKRYWNKNGSLHSRRSVNARSLERLATNKAVSVQRLRSKLWTAVSRLRSFFRVLASRWHTMPIEIRINLSADQLSPRDVMFEITTHFRHEVRRQLASPMLRAVLLLTFLYFATFPDRLPGTFDGAGRAISIGAAFVTALWLIRDIPIIRLSYSLASLHRRIVNTILDVKQATFPKFLWARKLSAEPLTKHQIEMALIRQLERSSRHSPLLRTVDTIVVFDELDKVSDSFESGDATSTTEYERLKLVENLLANIKTLLTIGKARFVVIAGREMLDRYQAERRITSSLYATLFDQYFEVPSLLTDAIRSDIGGFATMTETYVCRRLIRKTDAHRCWSRIQLERDRGADATDLEKLERALEEAARRGDSALMYEPYSLQVLRYHLLDRNDRGWSRQAIQDIDNGILLLRHFVHYLTFYSAGNVKKLESLFDSFVRPRVNRGGRETDFILSDSDGASLYLRFANSHQKRIILGSTLYVRFYHHLGQHLKVGRDKLAVASLTAFHHILKFHTVPFSRHELELVVGVRQIYRAPELDHTTDTLLTVAFRPILHKVRSGFYQYRFGYWFEQEVRYISRTSDLEAATYNFSLAAMEVTRSKLHRELDKSYRLFGEVGVPDSEKGAVTIAELNLSLGEVYALQQRHELAERCFEAACDTLRRVNKSLSAAVPDSRTPLVRICHIECLLKLGLTQERRSRFDRAACSYEMANELIRELKNDDGDSPGKAFVEYFGTSQPKRDLLTKAEYALSFLRLKRDPIQTGPLHDVSTFVGEPDASAYCQNGELAFYQGDLRRAAENFARCIQSSVADYERSPEDSSVVGGRACLMLADTLLLQSLKNNEDILLEAPDAGYESILEVSMDWLGAFVEPFACSSQGPPATLIDLLRLCNHASHYLNGSGRYYQAGMAHMHGVTLWGICFELYPTDALSPDNNRKLRHHWAKGRLAIARMVKEATKCLIDSDDKALVRFKDTHMTRDVNVSPRQLSTEESTGDTDVTLRDAILVEKAEDRSVLLSREVIWYASVNQQLLNWTAIWGDFVGSEFYPPGNRLAYLEDLRQCNIPLYPARSLAFSRWIIGRAQLRRLIEDGCGIKDRESLRHSLESLYCTAGRAIQNFYAAAREIDILAGNDKALMFPPQSFVCFHLWKTLAAMVELLVRYEEARDYKKAAIKVRQKLINEYVRRDVSGSNLDIRYVKTRALRYLRAAENVDDVAGRTRAEILRNRYYLSGDFVDQEFILEWTLIHCLRPAAVTLREIIRGFQRSLEPRGEPVIVVDKRFAGGSEGIDTTDESGGDGSNDQTSLWDDS